MCVDERPKYPPSCGQGLNKTKQETNSSVILHGKHTVDVFSSVPLGFNSSLWVHLNESQLSHNTFACKPPLSQIMDAALILLV